MISYIRGNLALLEEEKVIIDVGGVGYGIYMTGQSMSRLGPVGKDVLVHTFLNVKEDAMQLYGFLSRDELYVFRLLISVNGIGPKAAMGILSALTPDDLRFAVMAGDVKSITSAPGIGKKTAEKLILELKDKMKLEDVLEQKEYYKDGNTSSLSGDIQNDAVQALMALGYGSAESLKAVRQVKIVEGITSEELLKQALKYMVF